MFDCNRNIHPTGLSFWRRQKAVSLTKPITRCPDAPEEEGDPDPDGGGEGSPEGETTSYVEWCPTHERLLQVCKTLLLASDTCALTNAWCEIHLRERTICEEDPALTCTTNTWCEVHFRPMPLCREEGFTEEACTPEIRLKQKRLYRSIEMRDRALYYSLHNSMGIRPITTPGSGCCACPDHGPGGGETVATNITFTAGLQCDPDDTAYYCDIPGKVSGLTPSEEPFDQTFSYIQSGTVVTNFCTVGRLKIEPALSGRAEPTLSDIHAWDKLREGKYPLITIKYTPGAEVYFNLRTDIFLTNGTFTLALDGPPGSFELERRPAINSIPDYPPLLLSAGERLDIPAQAWRYQHHMVDYGTIPFLIRANAIGLTRLTYEYNQQTEHGLITFRDTMFIKTLPPALIPDYDRDGLWTETDLTAAQNREPFVFWHNDNKEGLDDKVNGAADWSDFFPVKLNLKEHLTYYPAEEYDYVAESPNGALNIWSYSLTPDGARGVAGELNPGAEEMNAARLENILTPGGRLEKTQRVDQIALYPELLESSATNAYSHALLFEGREYSYASLALQLCIKEKKSGEVVYVYESPVRIVSTEQMYRTIDLLEEAGERRALDNAYSPFTAPWGQDNQKHLLFIHGYNVDSTAARNWANDIFKRFYWSGSRAAFHAIHWYGFKSQGSLLISDFSPNYHINVENAFATAPAVAAYTRTLSGEVTLTAHSLGNMVASSAICHYNANVSDYVLLNAAVPFEAYRAQTEPLPNLVHKDWRPYVNADQERLLCSEWHALFEVDAEDPRNKLTWRGLFSDKKNTRFRQFYSTGEDVVNNPPEYLLDLNITWTNKLEITFTTPDQYSWATQELWKGRSYELWGDGWYLGSRLMGWGFNSEYSGWVSGRPTPEEAARDIDTVDLIRKPFFIRNPSELFSNNEENAKNYAQTHRLRLLAHAIPARTSGVGGTADEADVFEDSVNMNAPNRRNGWFRTTGPDASNWKHSDIRNMPFVNVKPIFQQIITMCSLKGNTL